MYSFIEDVYVSTGKGTGYLVCEPGTVHHVIYILKDGVTVEKRVKKYANIEEYYEKNGIKQKNSTAK